MQTAKNQRNFEHENKHNRESSRINHQEHTCTRDWEGGRGWGGTPCAHNSTTFLFSERLNNYIEYSRPDMITL